MIKAYLKFEFKQFITNRKNVAVLLIVLVYAITVGLGLRHQTMTTNPINPASLQQRISYQKTFLQATQAQVSSMPSVMTSRLIYPKFIQIEQAEYRAAKQADWATYAKENTRWHELVLKAHQTMSGGADAITFNPLFSNPDKYPLGGEFTGTQQTLRTIKLNKDLIKQNSATATTLQENTGWQKLSLTLANQLPLAFLLAVVFMAADIITKDRKHLALVNNFPISWAKRLLLKTGIVWVVSGVMIMVSLLVILLISSKMLGSATLPALLYHNLQFKPFYTVTSIAGYLLMWFTLLLVIIWWLLRLNTLLSIVLKNQWLNIILISLLIFSERFYFFVGIGLMAAFKWLPMPYFKVGDAITGQQDFLYVNYPVDSINWGQGLLTFLLWLVVVEGLLALYTRRKAYRFK